MTLLALEGFEHHGSTDGEMHSTLVRKHITVTGAWENEVGRNGGSGAAVNSNGDDLVINVGTSYSETIIGFAIKFRQINSNALDTILFIRNAVGGNLAHFVRAQNGKPRLLSSSGNVAYEADLPWRLFVWNYFEIRVLAGTNNSNGELEMYLNGQQVVNETGVDTFANSYSGIQSFYFNGNNHFNYILDDIYVINTSGTNNNTFLGDISIEALLPNAAGTTTDWSVTGAATNHEATDDNPFDDDTSYVSSSTTTDTDTYSFDNLTNITQGIVGVQMLPNGKKQGTGTREIAPVIRSGTTDYDQTSFNLATSYDYYPTIAEQDPDTGSAWTASGINGAEFGYKVNI